MKQVIGENKELYKRVCGIIAEHASIKENSKLVRRMAEESGKYSDDVVLLLNYILKGLEK